MSTAVVQKDRVYEQDGETVLSLPSPAIWGDVSILKVLEEGHLFQHWDFHKLPINDVDCVIDETDNGSVAQVAEKGGVLRVSATTADNDETWIELNTKASYVISDTAADETELRWEARCRVNSIVDDVAAVAIGLADLLAAGDNKVQADDTGELAAALDFLGFRSLHVNAGTAGKNAIIDWVYQITSGTQQDVKTSAHTIVASEWFKVGCIYRPESKTAKRISGFVNGVNLGSYVTGANIAAATFPDGVLLTPLLGLKTGSAATAYLDCDWFRIMQLRKT